MITVSELLCIPISRYVPYLSFFQFWIVKNNQLFHIFIKAWNIAIFHISTFSESKINFKIISSTKGILCASHRLLNMAAGVGQRPISVVCFCHSFAFFILVNVVILGSIFVPLTHHRKLIREFRLSSKSILVVASLQVSESLRIGSSHC